MTRLHFSSKGKYIQHLPTPRLSLTDLLYPNDSQIGIFCLDFSIFSVLWSVLKYFNQKIIIVTCSTLNTPGSDLLHFVLLRNTVSHHPAALPQEPVSKIWTLPSIVLSYDNQKTPRGHFSLFRGRRPQRHPTCRKSSHSEAASLSKQHSSFSPQVTSTFSSLLTQSPILNLVFITEKQFFSFSQKCQRCFRNLFHSVFSTFRFPYYFCL